MKETRTEVRLVAAFMEDVTRQLCLERKQEASKVVMKQRGDILRLFQIELESLKKNKHK